MIFRCLFQICWRQNESSKFGTLKFCDCVNQQLKWSEYLFDEHAKKMKNISKKIVFPMENYMHDERRLIFSKVNKKWSVLSAVSNSSQMHSKRGQLFLLVYSSQRFYVDFPSHQDPDFCANHQSDRSVWLHFVAFRLYSPGSRLRILSKIRRAATICGQETV